MTKVSDASDIPKESSENDKMVEVDESDSMGSRKMSDQEKIVEVEELDAEGSPEMSDQDKIDHLEKISDYIAYGKVNWLNFESNT